MNTSINFKSLVNMKMSLGRENIELKNKNKIKIKETSTNTNTNGSEKKIKRKSDTKLKLNLDNVRHFSKIIGRNEVYNKIKKNTVPYFIDIIKKEKIKMIPNFNKTLSRSCELKYFKNDMSPLYNPDDLIKNINNYKKPKNIYFSKPNLDFTNFIKKNNEKNEKIKESESNKQSTIKDLSKNRKFDDYNNCLSCRQDNKSSIINNNEIEKTKEILNLKLKLILNKALTIKKQRLERKLEYYQNKY